LFDESTLLQKTYKLISNQFNNENIFVVARNKYKDIILQQTQIKESNVFTEPMMRQTAPALGLALTLIEDNYDDETLICIFPSDQLISNLEEFEFSINNAYQAANTLDALVTIGIEPNAPIPYFGYIQYCQEEKDKRNSDITDELFKGGLRKSINFIEKPDEDTAKKFINSGGFA